MTLSFNIDQLWKECRFHASLSSGPGGQHVNKVNTRVELRFNIQSSQILTEEEKETLITQLANKTNSKGQLILISQDERSQLQNKNKAFEKLVHLLTMTLTPQKKRKPTQPKVSDIQKRLDDKLKISIKKKFRKPPEINH